MTDALDKLLASDSLDGLTTRPISELRTIRVSCAGAESDVSLVRRLAQGRLDIVGHELQRREGAPNTAVDVAELLFELPEILSADSGSAGGGGRAVSVGAPGAIAHELVAQLDAIASPTDLSGIEKRRDGELRELFERIRAFELELSSSRRGLHERIDAIQAEIGRRYRDGEATVDSILS